MSYLGSTDGFFTFHEECVYYIGDLFIDSALGNFCLNGDSTDVSKIELLEFKYQPAAGEVNIEVLHLAWANNKLGNSLDKNYTAISPNLTADTVSYHLEPNHPIVIYDNHRGRQRHTSVPFQLQIRRNMQQGFTKIHTEYAYMRCRVHKFNSHGMEYNSLFESKILNEPT